MLLYRMTIRMQINKPSNNWKYKKIGNYFEIQLFVIKFTSEIIKRFLSKHSKSKLQTILFTDKNITKKLKRRTQHGKTYGEKKIEKYKPDSKIKWLTDTNLPSKDSNSQWKQSENKVIKKDYTIKDRTNPKIHRLKIWDQLRAVITNNHMPKIKKQEAINCLKSLTIPTVFEDSSDMTAEPMSYVWSQVVLWAPSVQKRILPNLDYKTIVVPVKDKINPENQCEYIKKITKVLIIILVMFLRNKHDVHAQIIYLGLTGLMYLLVLSIDTDKENNEEFKTFNKLYIDFMNMNSEEIHSCVNNIQKMKGTIWPNYYRFIYNLIGKLSNEGLLKLGWTSDKTPVYRDFKKKEPTKRDRQIFNTRIVELDNNLKYRIDPYIDFFFSEWPQLVPIEVGKDEDTQHHSVLSQGKSTLYLNDLGRKTLNIVNRFKMKFNLQLYNEAVHIVDGESFELIRTNTRESCENNVKKARECFLKSRYIPSQVYMLEILQTISEFFILTDYSPFNWVKNLCLTNETKKVSKPFVELHQKLENITTKFGEIVVTDFIGYILRNLEVESNESTTIFQKWKDYTVKYKEVTLLIQNYITYKLDSNKILPDKDYVLDKIYLEFFNTLIKKGELKKVNEIDIYIDQINILSDTLSKLGISKLGSFYGLYKQNIYRTETVNIFDIWASKLIRQNYSKQEHKLVLNKSTADLNNYMKSVRDYSLFMSIKFKQRMMELYENTEFFYICKIAANGRFTFKGFSPHPHSGELFRFVTTKPQIINKNSLDYLKLAIVSSLKIRFDNNKSYLDWFTENEKKLKEYKTKSIPTFVYIDAYEKALKNEPTGVMIRLDQIASALTYWGLLANCPLYQKYVNLGMDCKNDPYTIISNQYLLPLLKEIKVIWEKELKTEKNASKQVIKEMILKVLCDFWIPACSKRDFAKMFVMPHAYGLTIEGVENTLIYSLKKEDMSYKIDTISHSPWIRSLSCKIFHQLNRISPRVSLLRNLLKKINGKMQDDYCEDTFKDGYTTFMEYPDLKIGYDYKSKVMIRYQIWNKECNYISTSWKRKTNKTNVTQNKNSFLPVLIHSIDGAVLREIIRICDKEHSMQMTSIHDCIMCHPNDMYDLSLAVNRAIDYIFRYGGQEKLTNKELLEKIWLFPSLKHQTKEFEDYIIKIWNNEWKSKKYQELKSDINYGCLYATKYNWFYE